MALCSVKFNPFISQCPCKEPHPGGLPVHLFRLLMPQTAQRHQKSGEGPQDMQNKETQQQLHNYTLTNRITHSTQTQIFICKFQVEISINVLIEFSHLVEQFFAYLLTFFRFLSGISSDISSDILPGISSDILSDMLSGLSSDSLSGTSSDILSSTFSDIFSHTLSGISSNILSGILCISPDIFSGVSSDILPDSLSGTCSDFFSGISSDILSAMLSGLSSDILPGISSNILSGILGISPDIFSVVSSDMLPDSLSGTC